MLVTGKSVPPAGRLVLRSPGLRPLPEATPSARGPRPVPALEVLQPCRHLFAHLAGSSCRALCHSGTVLCAVTLPMSETWRRPRVHGLTGMGGRKAEGEGFPGAKQRGRPSGSGLGRAALGVPCTGEVDRPGRHLPCRWDRAWPCRGRGASRRAAESGVGLRGPRFPRGGGWSRQEVGPGPAWRLRPPQDPVLWVLRAEEVARRRDPASVAAPTLSAQP